MHRELRIPDTSCLINTETLEVISTKGSRKIRKPDMSRCRGNRNEPSYMFQIEGVGRKHKRLHHIVAAAKYGRWPFWWEHVRHMDGNPDNHSFDNIELGDWVNNVIDELELGRTETTVAYIDKAIERLLKIKSAIES